MKKTKTKFTICLGVVCVLLAAISSWYTITYNESRLFVPMDLSEYVFQIQDLPMICSIILLILYILYLVSLIIQAMITNKRKVEALQTTRKINPKLGFLGFLGLLGILGFWTYSIDKSIFPFGFFVFFGFFGFFYEGKMSDTFMDKRYKENEMKAQLAGMKLTVSIIFISMIILGQGKFLGNLEYTLIALYIILALSLGLAIFLSEYLLYRYEHDEPLDEREE